MLFLTDNCLIDIPELEVYLIMEELTRFFSAYWLQIIIAVAAAYLISSVNTSIIVTRLVIHKDIRTMGSGNAGFTNVLRCVGKTPAIITFVGDFLKGVISVGAAWLLMMGAEGAEADIFRGYLMYIAGMFAVVGHTFPLYYKFRGGKGVVTSFSVMLMTDWRTLVCTLLIFAALFLISRIISFCSVIDFALFPFSTLLWRLMDYNGITSSFSPLPKPSVPFMIFSDIVALMISLLIIIRHKDNIKRLLNGTEKKIKAKKKEDADVPVSGDVPVKADQ